MAMIHSEAVLHVILGGGGRDKQDWWGRGIDAMAVVDLVCSSSQFSPSCDNGPSPLQPGNLVHRHLLLFSLYNGCHRLGIAIDNGGEVALQFKRHMWLTRWAVLPLMRWTEKLETEAELEKEKLYRNRQEAVVPRWCYRSSVTELACFRPVFALRNDYS
jgi:hypothetical protein